ncbi:acyl-CoA thioesterase domain-containing protein [Microbacterium sp. A588]
MLYGGWILGALAEAAQSLSESRLRELAVVYIAAVGKGEEVTVSAESLRNEGRFRHTRLHIEGAGGQVVAAQAMTGPELESGQSSGVPDVGRWQDWEPVEFGSTLGSGSSRLLEVRAVTDGDPSITKRVRRWLKVHAPVDSTVAVAVVSDAVPSALRLVMPESIFVPTMTAHLKMHARPDGDWMLVDVVVGPIDSLTASGEVKVWSSTGVLLASGTQTCRLLSRPPISPRLARRKE